MAVATTRGNRAFAIPQFAPWPLRPPRERAFAIPKCAPYMIQAFCRTKCAHIGCERSPTMCFWVLCRILRSGHSHGSPRRFGFADAVPLSSLTYTCSSYLYMTGVLFSKVEVSWFGRCDHQRKSGLHRTRVCPFGRCDHQKNGPSPYQSVPPV